MLNQPNSTWDWVNAIANWFAAVGTVSTAALALWLSVRDRQVRLKAEFSLGRIPGKNPKLLDQTVFVLEFVNNGPRTTTVTNHLWRLPFHKGVLFLFPDIDTPLASLCSRLPVELSDGKSGHIFYQLNHFKSLDTPEGFLFHPNRRIAWFRIRFFRLYLSTTIGKRVKVKVSSSVRKNLWQQYNAA